MHIYGVREVEKLLRLPRSAINSLIKAGFVTPARGPRNTFRFSFQDLIILRTAQTLAAANVPARRITSSLKALRRSLPDAMPLTGLAIKAVGSRVVVKEGKNHWQAESGQYLLAFDGDPEDGVMKVIERAKPKTQVSADDWFENGCVIERENPGAAQKAYEKAIAADPSHIEARINLAILLHETGDLKASERVYRGALSVRRNDSLLWYNLGVLLTDMKRNEDALEAYQEALQHNPRMADCHYNMALLCEAMKKPKQAIRHMAQYRRLIRKP